MQARIWFAPEICQRPCAVRLFSVSTISIFCDGCSSWVHKGSNSIFGTSNPDPAFCCECFVGLARHINMADQWQRRSQWERGGAIILGTTYPQMGIVDSLSLRDAKWHGLEIIQLAPAYPYLSLFTYRPQVYMLQCVCWEHPSMQNLSPKLIYLHHLHRDDWVMFLWIYGITNTDQVNSQDLERMQIDDMEIVLHTRLLRWHGHVKQWWQAKKNSRNAMPEEVVVVLKMTKTDPPRLPSAMPKSSPAFQ